MADQRIEQPSAGAGGSAETPRPEWRYFAELLGLSSLAIAQPILSTFAADPAAFVTARAGSFEVIAFALIVVLVPPAAIWVVELLVALVSRPLRRWLHLVALATLVALFFQAFVAGPLGALLAIAAAVGAAYAFARSETARTFLGYLAFAPLLFLAIFFLSPVSRLVFGSEPQAEAIEAPADLPPVVMAVFDELPLSSLLDGEGNIDADAFPNFAALAEDATFARNNTSVSPSTPFAVPPLSTGIQPSRDVPLPSYVQHPESLFTLLGGEYTMYSSEHVTQLCPESLCEVPTGEGSTRDAALVSLLKAAAKIPFGGQIFFDIGIDGLDPVVQVDWITDGIEAADDEPTLHYLHSMLPHQDWIYLPDGELHDGPNPPPGLGAGYISESAADATGVKQRHMLQLAYADELLGQILDSLRESGRYEDSLVVVTSDHGVAFEPGEPTRYLSEASHRDIMWTPLLVKAPQQQEPAVVDSPTTSVDVLPTIIDVLGIDTDWELDGQSILGPPREEDWQPRALWWKYDELDAAEDGFTYVDGVEGSANVLTRTGLEAPAGVPLRFWRWGPFGDLVGRGADEFEVLPADTASASLDDPDRFEAVDLSAPVLTSFLSGTVEGDGPATVVVAVNGVIGGSYDTTGGDDQVSSRRFHVMVPPELLVEGGNEIEVFLAERSGGNVRLTAVDVDR